ncbi:MAG: 6-hydroxymethylpterin diphosphokinase MptE-like protein, partial [Verrucomicrobiota bacterium]
SRMLGCPDLRELKGRFEGRTMVLVSAGPSLDEALPFVKAACEDALVVAVNSSYRALRNAGIAPHFVMAADPYEHTAKGFEGVETEGTILVAPFIVYPKVSELFEGRTVTWSENNVLATSFREALGLGVGSRVVEQGTVSACGFDLAKVLGCRRILMVGQDLAAREDGQTHATDSFYTGEGLNFTDVEACRWMPGNTIEKVPVESKLYVYLKTFEQLAGSYGEDLELVNTSRLGARIEGIPYEPAEAAFGRLGDERYEWDLGERFEEVFEDVSKRRVESDPIRDEMKRLSAYLKGVSSTALSIALEIEIGGEGGFAEDSQLEELRRKERELDGLVQSDPRFEGILREGQLKLELARFKKEMRALGEDLSERERSLERTKGLCWALAEGAFRLYCDSREGMGEGTHEEQALR